MNQNLEWATKYLHYRFLIGYGAEILHLHLVSLIWGLIIYILLYQTKIIYKNIHRNQVKNNRMWNGRVPPVDVLYVNADAELEIRRANTRCRYVLQRYHTGMAYHNESMAPSSCWLGCCCFCSCRSWRLCRHNCLKIDKIRLSIGFIRT